MKRPHEDGLLAEEPPSQRATLPGFSGVLPVGGMPPGLGLGLGMDLSLGSLGQGTRIPPGDSGGIGLYLNNKSNGGMSELAVEARVATTPMDFTNLGKGTPTQLVPVPKNLVKDVMTPDTRRLIEEQSGAEIEWAPDMRQGPQMMVRGGPEQVRLAAKLFARVKTHCHWGCNADKIKRLLKPRIIEKALLRLSPMDSLSNVEKHMSPGTKLSIGKGRENDAVVHDDTISRVHCFLELSADKGSIYIADCSTNGTYLNGVRLPSRKLGKVLVSHGDELLLKEPSRRESEFGYIVNITVIHAKEEVKLEAPRRILTGDEVAGSHSARDFNQ